MDKYTKELMASVILIAILFLAFAIFLAKANNIPTLEGEIKTRTESVVAINCTYKGTDCYEVTIRDRNGNDWAYYDTEYIPKETKLTAIFTDGRVVDIEGR